MPKRTSAVPLCRHTKTDGRLCNSPAVTDRAFCHFHQKRTRRAATGPGMSTHVLQPLDNARSIQQALAMVFTGVAAGRIHPKTAGKMLYSLQIASSRHD